MEELPRPSSIPCGMIDDGDLLLKEPAPNIVPGLILEGEFLWAMPPLLAPGMGTTVWSGGGLDPILPSRVGQAFSNFGPTSQAFEI